MNPKPALDAQLNHHIQITAPEITTAKEEELALSGVGAKDKPDQIAINQSIPKIYFFSQ